MKLGSRRMILPFMGTAVVCLLRVAPASGQAAPEQKPLMVEDVFKNVQVLKGIPVNQFMQTMGFFSASLGLNCTYCHVTESLANWEKFAEDVPLKRTARRMILMVNAINKDNFQGRRVVTCYSCHHGGQRPKVIPSLAEQYSTPEEDPNEVEITGQAPAGPSADQILDKYIQALGGAQRLAGLTSFVAKGTYEGFETFHMKVLLEVFAKAPAQRTTIVHTLQGNSTTTYDGRVGWVAAIDKPVPVLSLAAGDDLDGAKLDADLSFPARVNQALTQWRVGFPAAFIGERETQIVQGTSTGGSRVKLYFDKESGLLLRTVRYTATPVGIVPTQTDYSDYREVAGVKMPFHTVVTWTDGQATTELSEVQPNVPIDAAKFAKPSAPVAPPRKPATQ